VARSSVATANGGRLAPLSALPPELPDLALDIAGGGGLKMGRADPAAGWPNLVATGAKGADPVTRRSIPMMSDDQERLFGRGEHARCRGRSGDDQRMGPWCRGGAQPEHGTTPRVVLREFGTGSNWICHLGAEGAEIAVGTSDLPSEQLNGEEGGTEAEKPTVGEGSLATILLGGCEVGGAVSREAEGEGIDISAGRQASKGAVER
jgi:hypothetical protein